MLRSSVRQRTDGTREAADCGCMKNPPSPATDIVVIGASTGGVEALRLLVAGLPSRFPPAVLIVMHIGTQHSILPSLLARTSILPVRQARHGDLVEGSRVLVAPPDLHLTLVREGAACRVVLARTAKENYTRPAIDPLFRSAAAVFGQRAVGVILTGGLDDGTAGLAAIKACGGTAIVQDPEEALAPGMPASAMENVDVDQVLPLEDIPPALIRLMDAQARFGAPTPREEDVPEWVKLENKFALEGVDMQSLDLLAKPSTYTCPECHGTLWELNDQRPRRFRCHTGHAYTERNLVALQGELVEDSIWTAVRALQEREMLLRRMAEEASLGKLPLAGADYTAQADEARRSAEVLRGLMTHPPAVDV
jgi:two-component system, chemotaxis family, protein-glutamate methylesterase/glutaminase